MRPVGDCYDDAVIESFWARMQVELLDRKRCNTRIELAKDSERLHETRGGSVC